MILALKFDGFDLGQAPIKGKVIRLYFYQNGIELFLPLTIDSISLACISQINNYVVSLGCA